MAKELGAVQFSVEWPYWMKEDVALGIARRALEADGATVGATEKEDEGVYLIEVDDNSTGRLEKAGSWEAVLDAVLVSAEWP